MKLTPLKLARLKRGMPQYQLSHEAKINRSRMSELENGHVQAKDEELARISKVLGAPIAELKGAEG